MGGALYAGAFLLVLTLMVLWYMVPLIVKRLVESWQAKRASHAYDTDEVQNCGLSTSNLLQTTKPKRNKTKKAKLNSN